MNVFKLLSRSSKAAQTSPAQKLPSSGAVANPQLFGHDEPTHPSDTSNTSRKRKRGQNLADASASATELPADLDFFGGGASKDSESSGNTLSKKQRKKQKQQERKEEAILQEGAGEIEEEPYNADECKRVLRSHKLKVAILDDFATQVEEPSKEKKSKKRKKEKWKEKKEKKKS